MRHSENMAARMFGRRGKAAAMAVRLVDHGFDPGLYAELRDLRAQLARQEKVPTYVVFNNKTLEALARHRPSTTEEALAVPGVGEVKAGRYVRPFLEVIASWRKSRGE